MLKRRSFGMPHEFVVGLGKQKRLRFFSLGRESSGQEESTDRYGPQDLHNFVSCFGEKTFFSEDPT